MANAVELMQSIENRKEDVPQMAPGDNVKVHVRIVEGDRERLQVFQGVVISVSIPPKSNLCQKSSGW